MKNDLKQLLARYRSMGILLDTNLLLLYLIGLFDPDRIERFKRTEKFSYEDFQILSRIMRPFKIIRTLPHVLAEVNSLSGQLHRNILASFREKFKAQIKLFEEVNPTSINASERQEFYYLGLTDAAIILESIGKCLVLTDDLPLYIALNKAGVDVLNFTAIRYAVGL
jgi:hypothetical protein